MAETEPLPRKTHHPDLNPNPNPTKYFTRFLYKSAFVLIFLVIIPLFPSQAPEFIHQSFPTRSWELLHLIFVGIAVSYGLFSRKNDDASDKDAAHNNNPSMFDHAQSYISRIFHVSPPFGEETDAPLDENKVVQTWSSQYTRNDPVVMVAKESEGSEIREKPLLLPIRSLKSRVFEGGEEKEHGDEQPSAVSASFSRSSSMNKKKINDLQEKKEKEEKPKDDLVLPSPIPWRSRSGRLELKEEVQEPRLSRSQTLEPRVSGRLSPPKSVFLEPKKPRIIGEDFVRKKSFRKSNPAPPPPPPPPPPMPPRVPPAISKSSSMKPSRASVDRDVRRVRSGFEPGNPYEDDLPRKSVRTVRSGSGKARVEDEPMNFEFVEVPKEEDKKYDFVKEELDSESDQDSSEEDNHNDGDASNDGGGSGNGDGGPDVDKKADEFIAKFREQIRLQRIESIKRSSAEISKRVHR